MSTRVGREDLVLAAYAVGLGYKLRGHHDTDIALAHFTPDGIPVDSLQYTIGDISVWNTARGWRVGRLVDGVYQHAKDSDFYAKLNHALVEGAHNWRDR